MISCKKELYKKANLEEVDSFGSNSGNLKMFIHKPVSITTGMPMPLVVVLHGCSQNARTVEKSTDWNMLADKYGFYVLYPEQKTINNVSSCFNWFLNSDNERNKGEASSIKAMTQYMIDNFLIDATSIHVTGLSAGAAMTMVMLSAYPEVYHSGAPLAGIHYKGNKTFLSNKSAEELGNFVKNQNPTYAGDYPKLMILQGKKDIVVNYKNANKIEDQWLNLFYGTDLSANEVEQIDFNTEIHTYNNYKNNNLVVKKVIFDKIGHAIPIDVGSGTTQGGSKGIYAKDIDYFSSYWIAEFFGLVK